MPSPARMPERADCERVIGKMVFDGPLMSLTERANMLGFRILRFGTSNLEDVPIRRLCRPSLQDFFRVIRQGHFSLGSHVFSSRQTHIPHRQVDISRTKAPTFRSACHRFRCEYGEISYDSVRVVAAKYLSTSSRVQGAHPPRCLEVGHMPGGASHVQPHRIGMIKVRFKVVRGTVCRRRNSCASARPAKP